MKNRKSSLVQSQWMTHRRFDDQRTNVLPLLLQQGDQEVDGQENLGNQDFLLHLNVTDTDIHTQDLLQLELDGRSDVTDLLAQVFLMGNWSWELTQLRKLRTE